MNKVRLILCANFELAEFKFGKKLLSRIVVFHEFYYFEVIIRLSKAIKAIELVNIMSKEEMDLFALMS